ncbi:MAG: GMC family oxidoreductase [Sandaracinaceae bacterium]|nr:GMC family oxidoreductase [Sandaracinaceae bacterium]
MTVHHASKHAGDLELSCDVVVIGSGAGGAVLATELALAGRSVIVLEEGRHVPAEVHGRMRDSQSLRHLWRDGGLGMAFGLGGSPSVNLTVGRGVGGSSMLTGGVCFRVPEDVNDAWAKEMGLSDLSAKGLDPYYSRVEEAVHVEEVPEHMRSRSTSLFAEGAAKLGHPLEPTRRNTKGCNGCGRCNFGCPHQAKLSVDLSYLPRAMAAGAEVFSDCLVTHIEHENGRASGVRGRIFNGPGRKPKGRLRVQAKVVVSSCGGLHTPVLLKSSGLAGFGSQIGENLTLHPGFRVFARFEEEVRGWDGAMQSAFTNHFHHERLMLMSIFIPASIIAAQLPGAGPNNRRELEAVPHIACFGAMVHDDGPGTVRRGIGREPIVTYRMSARDKVAMFRAIRLTAETYFAAGAKVVHLPVLGSGPVDADGLARFPLEQVSPTKIECGSQHPLGTCRMGTAAAWSGVNANGRLWGTENVYVADGSVIPSSLGVNPQLTIMAMSTRIAERILDAFPRHRAQA